MPLDNTNDLIEDLNNLGDSNDIKTLWESITGSITGTITVYQRQSPFETEIIPINLDKWMLGENALVVPIENARPSDKGAVKDANGKVVLADIDANGDYILHIGYDEFDDPIPPATPLVGNYALIWQIKGDARDTFIIPTSKEVKDFDSDPAFVRDPDNNQIIAVHYGDDLNMGGGGFFDDVRDTDVLYVNRIEEKKQQEVTVAKDGGDFTTIQEAVDSITDASSTKQYLIRISPGIYTENVINKDYVNFEGSGLTLTILNGTLQLGSNFEGSKMTVQKTITTNETIVDGATNTGGRITLIDFSINAITSTVGVKPVLFSVNTNNLYTENFGASYTNTSGGAIGSDTILIDFQGTGSYTITQSSFVSVSNQSSGNIYFFNDNNSGVTRSIVIIAFMVMNNASWDDKVSFVNQINNSSDKHAIGSSDITMIGGGLGICETIKNNSGGALSTIVDTRFTVGGFTKNCVCNAENVGDDIDFTFSVINEELSDGEAFCGNGAINRVYRDNGNLVVNTDIIDLGTLIGTPTNDSLQDMFNIGFNAGWVSGQGITNNLDGTITVALGTGYIRTSNDEQAPLKTFDIIEFADISLIDQSSNYIYVDYNSGSPIVLATTSSQAILDNENDKYEIWEVFREGTDLHITDHRQRAKNVGSRLQQRLYSINRIERSNTTGGLIISESADTNRYVSVSASKLWVKINPIPFIKVNTDPAEEADSLDRYYGDGGSGFTKTTGNITWNNTQYDDGSGILATMNNNWYSWQDFWAEADGDVVSVFGTNQFALQQNAIDADIVLFPNRLVDHALYIGRIVFQKNGTIATQVLTAFGLTLFGASAVTSHPNLTTLGWTSSGHTGTALKLAGFDAGGLATEYDRNPFDQDLNTTDDVDFNSMQAGNVLSGGNIISAVGDGGLSLYDNAGNGLDILDGGNANFSHNLDVEGVLTVKDTFVFDGTAETFSQYSIEDSVYPTRQNVNLNHNLIYDLWDAYHDGTNFRSSNLDANFMINKQSNAIIMSYDAGIAQGDVIPWHIGWILKNDGTFTVGGSSTGSLGVGEPSPETAVEITNASPYLTLHNSTHEDALGGRKCRIIAKGEQSGTEKTTLGYFEFSHDGGSDDQKGKLGIYLNGGSEGDAPTLRASIDSAGLLYIPGKIGIEDTSVHANFKLGVEGAGTASWEGGAYFGGVSSDKVVVGELSGNATIGGHNSALSAWASLTLNGTTSPAVKIFIPALWNNPIVGGRDVYVQATGELTYFSSSEESKANIEDIDGWENIYNLQPKKYNARKRISDIRKLNLTEDLDENNMLKWEEDTFTDEYFDNREDGLIAQDVAQYFPHLTWKDPIYDEEGNTIGEKIVGFNYKGLIPSMIMCIQDLNTRTNLCEDIIINNGEDITDLFQITTNNEDRIKELEEELAILKAA